MHALFVKKPFPFPADRQRGTSTKGQISSKTMAHIAKLRRPVSAAYWLPRAATRAKPIRGCHRRASSPVRRGGDLPGKPGAPAASIVSPKTSAIFLAALQTGHPRRCAPSFSSAVRPGRRQRTTGGCLWWRGWFLGALRTPSAPWSPRRRKSKLRRRGLRRGRSRDRPPPTPFRRGRTTPRRVSSLG